MLLFVFPCSGGSTVEKFRGYYEVYLGVASRALLGYG